jgi:hypothetical protein
MLRYIAVLLIAVAPVVAQVTPNLLYLLPEDAVVVAGVNLKASSETPFGEYVLGQMAAHSNDIEELLADTDFDLRQDLNEIVVGATGLDKESQALVLARGVFNPERILAHAQAKGAIISTFDEVKMIRGKNERSPAIAFLTMDMVAFGKPEQVLAVIERHNDGDTVDTEATAKALDMAGNHHAWFVMIGSPAELAGKSDLIPEGSPIQGDLIRSIEQLSGGSVFGETVILTLSAVTATPESAQALGNVVQFFLSFARLNAEDPEMAELLGRMLRDLDITADSTSVTVTLPVAQADIEDFMARNHHGEDNHETKRTTGEGSGRTGRTSRGGRGR